MSVHVAAGNPDAAELSEDEVLAYTGGRRYDTLLTEPGRIDMRRSCVGVYTGVTCFVCLLDVSKENTEYALLSTGAFDSKSGRRLCVLVHRTCAYGGVA